MRHLNSLKSKVFQLNPQNLEKQALEVFRFQYNNNKIYRDYIDHLDILPDSVDSMIKIPYLPIRFFKSHEVTSVDFKVQQVFESSGTAGNASKHNIEDLGYYQKVSTWIFEAFFGKLDGSIVIGLLPSYLERDNSSLVFMVNHFIKRSGHPKSGFYLDNFHELSKLFSGLSDGEGPIYLFGVTFALLAFAENYQLDHEKLIILETGGMKGRGKELVREELHAILGSSFHTDKVFSEYGMTELLSQAYMKKNGYFSTPPWMQVQIRDIYDPFKIVDPGKTGVIQVMDLANVHSCAFIETEDLGRKINNEFQVLGRLDNADLRGCNLLVS